jgi:hypothetical protein
MLSFSIKRPSEWAIPYVGEHEGSNLFGVDVWGERKTIVLVMDDAFADASCHWKWHPGCRFHLDDIWKRCQPQ